MESKMRGIQNREWNPKLEAMGIAIGIQNQKQSGSRLESETSTIKNQNENPKGEASTIQIGIQNKKNLTD